MKCLILLAGLLLSLPVAAQIFPERTPRILGGFAAGGTSDIVNRILAESAATTLGMRPVVEVKTGANGFIAAAEAVRSPHDGHTIVQCSTGLLTITPELPGASMAIDPNHDLIPIANFAHSTQVMVVASTAAESTVAVMVRKSLPRQLMVVSTGAASMAVVNTVVQLRLKRAIKSYRSINSL